MGKVLARILTHWGAVNLTEFVGPAELFDDDDRRCLQVGDSLRLTPSDARTLVDEIEEWLYND